jgi:VWFA-related protein
VASRPPDFTLSVDGKPVAVEYFSEIRDGRLQPVAEAPIGAPHDGGVQPLAAAAAGTNYLVYIDDYFAVASQRDLILAGLRASLDQLRPEDHMAIVAFDGARLSLLSGWSDSPRQLAAAIDRAMARKPHGMDLVVEHDRFRRDEMFRGQIVGEGSSRWAGGSRPLDLTSSTAAPAITRAGGLNEAQRSYGEAVVRRVKASAGGAVSAMRAFAAPEGRKVLLLLAGGWPFSVRSLLAGDASLPTHDLPEGNEVLGPLTNAANLIGYTIYPVDVPGPTRAGPDIEFPVPPTGAGLLQEEELDASLRFIARETGGRPILGRERILALSSASADTRSFYWLGFAPSWRGDDRLHRLKVEVKRPGLSVRSRSGFLDLSRQAEVSMRLESALLLGTFPGALTMPIQIGAPRRVRPGKIELPVTLGLPVDLMTVVPVGGKYAVELELRFAASADSGATSQIPVVPITLTSATPPRPGGFVRHQTTVTLGGPANHLVVAAYDPVSDRVATAEVELSLKP